MNKQDEADGPAHLLEELGSIWQRVHEVPRLPTNTNCRGLQLLVRRHNAGDEATRGDTLRARQSGHVDDHGRVEVLGSICYAVAQDESAFGIRVVDFDGLARVQGDDICTHTQAHHSFIHQTLSHSASHGSESRDVQ